MWEAEREIAQLVKCSEKYANAFTTAVGTAEYSLPSDCVFVQRVLWNKLRMKRIEFRELERMEGLTYGASIQQGQPEAYYLFAGKMGLYPTPNAAHDCEIWYIAEPVVITENSTAFTIDKMFHTYITHYVMWQMWSKDQESDRTAFFRKQWDADLAAATVKWAEYQRTDQLARVKDEDIFTVTDSGMI
jgi:hypothetical protein